MGAGERLDERPLKEADRPDMLPLVRLALSRLWEARETQDGATVPPFTAYEKLGGVKAIVAEAGEGAQATHDAAARLLVLAGEEDSVVVRLAHQRVLSDWARAGYAWKQATQARATAEAQRQKAVAENSCGMVRECVWKQSERFWTRRGRKSRGSRRAMPKTNDF